MDKHTGKFISTLTNDVDHITNLISTAVLNIFKDSLTLMGLLTVMFFQNWRLACCRSVDDAHWLALQQKP